MFLRRVLFAVAVIWPFHAAAQLSPPAQPLDPSPRVVAGRDGFAIESPTGDFHLQIGLLMQAFAFRTQLAF